MNDVETRRYIKWITEALAATGKTRIGLARHLNLAHPQITQLLKGRRRLKVDEVPRIAEYLGVPPPNVEVDVPDVMDVPMISMVSAGQMADHVHDLSDLPTVPAINLPEGDWIAMRVDGPSMNKISPPDSIIFVNTRDKRLVSNGCYIIADETGAATYKRYRPNEDPPFQPASYEDIEPPKLEGAIRIVGRVKRSMIDM